MDKQLLHKLMYMSRLNLPDDDQETVLQDLRKICDWIKKLQALDTTDVVPLTTLVGEQPILREDIPTPPLDHAKALARSQKSDSNYFRVPKVKA